MRAVKILAIALISYAAVVASFESLIGYLQPMAGDTLVMTTSEGSGSARRVLARLEVDGQLYVAANHWPRAWYRRALANPEVRVEIAGSASERRAIAVSGDEADRVGAEKPLGPIFRALTGYPPRRFLRLDPR